MQHNSRVASEATACSIVAPLDCTAHGTSSNHSRINAAYIMGPRLVVGAARLGMLGKRSVGQIRLAEQTHATHLDPGPNEFDTPSIQYSSSSYYETEMYVSCKSISSCQHHAFHLGSSKSYSDISPQSTFVYFYPCLQMWKLGHKKIRLTRGHS